MDVLAGLKPDIWFSSHPDFFNYNDKINNLGASGRNPFIDPKGYQLRIENERKKFVDEVEKEKQLRK